MKWDATVTVNLGYLFIEEVFIGHECKVCEDAIYGAGFRMVTSSTVNNEPLPRFRETNFILCQSCKNTVK